MRNERRKVTLGDVLYEYFGEPRTLTELEQAELDLLSAKERMLLAKMRGTDDVQTQLSRRVPK